MSESATIHPDALPLTVSALAEQFTAGGLKAGQTVLVHSAMSKLGWVVGGPNTVIEALLSVLGPTGTLMMPTHTTDNTDPENWQNPPVPAHWWPIIRANMPAFDPAITPTRQMGTIPELFRTYPNVIRSNHPISSFAALGPNAQTLLENHHLKADLGEGSPLSRLYDLDGYVLLLGVGHSNNTSLHLAEYRAHFVSRTLVKEGTAMFVKGKRQWVVFDVLDLNSDDFDQIGAAYETEAGYQPALVGKATMRLLRQKPMVDYAVKWMERNRT